jgi:BolA protein
MSVQQILETKLAEALQPEFLSVVNESSGHNVPRGSETHFRVLVVSTAFDGVPLVGRHRLVNAALAQELRSGVHALAIDALTPDQWRARGAESLTASPACQGGNGK